MTADAVRRAPSTPFCPDHRTTSSRRSRASIGTFTPIPSSPCRSIALPASPPAWLREHGYEVTEGVGGTGVVGLLRNGDGPDRAAARRHGRAPDQGEHRPALCQQRRPAPTASARPLHRALLRSRHARCLADGRDADPGREPGRWRGTVMAVFQPGEETGSGRARDDRGRHGQALPEAGRHPGPARDAALAPARSAGAPAPCFGRRQLGGDAVRPRRARLDAAEEHRSGRDGGLGGDAPADRRVARGRDDRLCRGHRRHPAAPG